MMKVLLAFTCFLAVVWCKTCAPDMYVQEFLQTAAVASPEGQTSTSDSIYLFYADYKMNMTLNNFTSVDRKVYHLYMINDYNKGVSTYVDFDSRTCKTLELKERMPAQCLPDDVKTIAQYNNVAGQRMKVIRFTLSSGDICTQTLEKVGDYDIPVVQTIALKNSRGSAFVTQLFGPASDKFDERVFQIPSFCKL